MSCACVVEPAVGKAGLIDLCTAVGLCEPIPVDTTIIRVVVLPTENAWRIVVSGDQELYAAERAALECSLASALGLSWVALQSSTISIHSNDADNTRHLYLASPTLDVPHDSKGETPTATDETVIPVDNTTIPASPTLNGSDSEDVLAINTLVTDQSTEDTSDDDPTESEIGDEAHPISDEDYMAMLVQRMRDTQSDVQRTTKDQQNNKPDEIYLGQKIAGMPQPIISIQDEERSVIVAGQVTIVNVRDMRSGRRMVSFDVSDMQDSLTVKFFAEEKDEWVDRLRVGMWLKVRGPVQYDKFTQELTLLPKDVCSATPPPGRQDTAERKRVELHLHTKMSALDGVSHVADVIAQAKEWGHPAVAITDHGVVQAFPEAFAAAQQHKMKVLYGSEGYLCDNAEEKGRTYHVIILAATLPGLQNLYRLVSLAHLDHFYRRPRMPRQDLMKLRSGLIIGSACEAGEVYQAALANVPDSQLDQIASFYDYLEIQPLSNTRFLLDSGRLPDEEALRNVNRRILASGRRLNKPVVATSDAHYIDPEEDIYRRILMAGHGFSDVENTAPLYFKTTDEMLTEFSYLGEDEARRVVIDAPNQIADCIEELRPIPEGFYPPELEGAADQIRGMSEQKARELYGDPLPDVVANRLEKELHSIIGNGFSSLYLIAHKLVKKSVDDGYLVGSRGSVGSSLVALLCGISEVNPLPPHYVCSECHYFAAVDNGSVDCGFDLSQQTCPNCGKPLRRDGFNIPFETFLGFKGDKTPDIDLNFSGDYQPRAHKYTEELFGKEYVFRAGTIGTLAEKTAFGYVRKYMDEKNQKARTAEMNRLALGLTGVRKTTGQHPGGMIVVPKGREIYEFTPIQHPANDKHSGTITTHFEFKYVHDQLLKLDILGHDGPTMIRSLEDMTGVRAATIPLDDPDTMKLFSSIESLGIKPEEAGGSVGTLALPEFNTRLLRQMLEDTRPTAFADLVRIMGLSHGELVWIGNQQDLVRNKTITLTETIACRDDIMSYLIRKDIEAPRAFKIMEQVRKGKGLSSDDDDLMKQHSVPGWYIDACKKISYMFPKAHAAAYAIMAFWQGYYKVHHPLEFYATFFTVRADEFDIELVLQGRKAVQKMMKETEAKGNDATAKEKGTASMLEVVLEAMARGIEFLPVDLYESDVRKFIRYEGKLRPPLTSLQGVGESAALSLKQARMDRPFTSVEDLRKRGGVSRAVTDVLSTHGALGDLPESDQLSLF